MVFIVAASAAAGGKTTQPARLRMGHAGAGRAPPRLCRAVQDATARHAGLPAREHRARGRRQRTLHHRHLRRACLPHSLCLRSGIAQGGWVLFGGPAEIERRCLRCSASCCRKFMPPDGSDSSSVLGGMHAVIGAVKWGSRRGMVFAAERSRYWSRRQCMDRRTAWTRALLSFQSEASASPMHVGLRIGAGGVLSEEGGTAMHRCGPAFSLAPSFCAA